MPCASIYLLADTNGKLSVTGNAVRGDGFYGFPEGTHTVSISMQNFVGRVWIEAALASQPTDTDWFSINLTLDAPYLEFDNETSTRAYTFEGNFTFIRARLDRSYIFPVPETSDEIASFGVIRKILLNH
jgi:hypothetical protein